MSKPLNAIAAILAFMAYSSVGAAPEMSHDQTVKLKELESCLKSLPKSGDEPTDSACAEVPVSILQGVSIKSVVSSLGSPSWCSNSRATYFPWTEQGCGGTTVWGYSFYYLPSTYLGGGSELQFTLDKNQLVEAVNWVSTQ